MAQLNLNILLAAGLALSFAGSVPSRVQAEEATPEKSSLLPNSEGFAVHLQATVVDQATAAFKAPYRGPNSLNSGARGQETTDVTLYAGFRPWAGGEIWVNPEVDQGFGLSNTLGVAGFPSGEGYKVGHNFPYVVLHRLFLRQTLNLGGEVTKVEGDQNVLEGRQTADRLVLTLGKVSVGDIFDTNAYAHDPRSDFFNWTVIDAGTFDYAADAWGYTYGAAAELYKGDWTLRTGTFAMSRLPNGQSLDASFNKFQTIYEIEHRQQLLGQPGSVKLTGFVSRAPMGTYADAVRQGQVLGAAPNVLDVKRYQTHAGISLNLQQQVNSELGLFARAGISDGHQQAYEFTDVSRSVSLGAALSGGRWGRPQDTWGVAGVVNNISSGFKTYLSRGGLGILVGDGQLPHPGAESILETYYNLSVSKAVKLSLDYQFVANPAYNRDRGPVSVIGVRLHGAL